jgi:hypothetical protein
MKTIFEGNTETYTLRLIEDRTTSRWLSLAGSATFLSVFEAYFLLTKEGWILPIVIGIILGTGTCISLRNLFGVAELNVSESSLCLSRRLFFFSHTRRFQRSDIEWVGYSPEVNAYRNHVDSALLLMVRSDVTPITFGRTIRPDEAAALFTELCRRSTWIIPLIRPVGKPPF